MYTCHLNQRWGRLLRIAMLWAFATAMCWADSPVNGSFKQSVYVDETQVLDIQAIQQVTFQPLDGVYKLNFSHSVVWLKLEETEPLDSTVDWYMKFYQPC